MLLTGVQTPLAQTNWVVVVGLVAGFILSVAFIFYTLSQSREGPAAS